MSHLAYVDSGSASMVVSVVVGGFSAVGMFFKAIGRKLTSPFRRKSADSDAQRAAEPTA